MVQAVTSVVAAGRLERGEWVGGWVKWGGAGWGGVALVWEEGGKGSFPHLQFRVVVERLCVYAATCSRALGVHWRLPSHDSGNAAGASHHSG